MSLDSQIRNRLDAGDLSGAVRLEAKKRVEELQRLRIAAATQFIRKHPELELNGEFFASGIQQALDELGLQGISLSELERAFYLVAVKLAPVAEYEEQRRQKEPAGPASKGFGGRQ